jgi:hypothetical protein
MIKGAVVACAIGAPGIAAATDLIAHDSFQYPSTPNLHGMNGGVGWSSQWFKLSAVPSGVSSDGLTWLGLRTSGGCATTAPYSAGYTRYSRACSPYVNPDDTVYISCLIRPNPNHHTIGGLAFGTWDNGMVMGARPTGVYGLMTPPDTDHSDTLAPVIEGQTSLLVARVHNNGNGTVTWSLFTNPQVGDAEPAQPEATLTIPGTTLPQAIMIYNDGGFSTDEIRVGHTWSSVLPPVSPIGDVTSDGLVNVDDLIAVILAWGPCPTPCPADVNGDGAVDVDDLILVILNWS